jgi:WS/DGAT/MGAT family acyltransferase
VVDAGRPFVAPHWEPDETFDLALHLHHARLPEPGGEAALSTFIADLVSTPLPHDRPLWHAYLVDDVSGATALVVRIHHCIADGVALVRLLLALCDGRVAAPPSVGLAPRATPNAAELVERLAREAATVGRLLLLPQDPETPLKGPLGHRKLVAWSRPIPLAEVKRVAAPLGAKVNDVLQACVAGSIRRYLSQLGELPSQRELRSLVPVFLRGGAHGLGNHFGLVFVDLPVHEPSALGRVREIKRRMDTIKAAEDATVAFAVLDAVGVASPELEHVALEVFTRKASLLTTNVPGPAEAARIGGHALKSLLVWAPTAGYLGLGVTLVSYAGEVRVGVASDSQRVSQPQRLVAAFEQELAELGVG